MQVLQSFTTAVQVYVGRFVCSELSEIGCAIQRSEKIESVQFKLITVLATRGADETAAA